VPGVERAEGGAFHRDLGEVAVELRAGDGWVDVELRATGAAPADSAPSPAGAALSAGFADAERAVRRVLDADTDPRPIHAALGGDPLLGPLIRARPGLRCPGAFDAYEVAVRAIVGQAISVAAARTILGRLAERGLFPGRDGLAHARPEELPMPRLRAEALIALARGVPLGEIRGVGPWTRGYVALRTGDPDVLLTGDLVVRRSAERLGGPASARALERLGERWRPFRSTATHHLWAAA
jgi:AraC family transcriptional regulator of adaptative response / DNA-3-methyladenine glycosylase II